MSKENSHIDHQNGKKPSSLRDFVYRLVDLEEGIDREGTVYNIRYNKNMEGANAWMLMCSIMIASLGLDLGSPAVIIGAMLISPLMSPILGVGLAIGTNDLDTLRISTRHFIVAIAIALLTSTIYFLLTPLGTVTPEILSRTKPTALDVLIAFFGGVAGIISMSRKSVSSAIPGVAIATALMPPLCVTGFGLAEGNWDFALKAFYLFFLNSFFVVLATFLLVRYLRFPYVEFLDPQSRARKIVIIMAFSMLMLIPSILLLKDVYKDVRTKATISEFVDTYLQEDKKFIDDWQFVRGDTVNKLIIKAYGTDLVERQTEFEEALARTGIPRTEVEVIPTAEFDLEKIQALEAEISGFEKIAAQLRETRVVRSTQDKMIDSLRNALTEAKPDTMQFRHITRELKALFPDLSRIHFSEAQTSDFENYGLNQPLLILTWKPGKSGTAKRTESQKIKSFLEERLDLQDIELIYK